MTQKKRTSEFGDYRSTHDSLWDDLDFQKLSPLAKTVWHALKSKLGRYGIAVFYIETLPRLVNATPTEIRLAINELERAKPGKDHGWLVNEEHVFWLVNGLRFEPFMDLKNPDHVTGARRYARALPKLPIVDRFRAYYGLADTTIGSGSPPPSPLPPPHLEGLTDTEREPDTEPETDPESETTARARDASPRSRFLAAFYPTATAPRVAEVIRQLDLSLTPEGARIRGKEFGHARSPEHLDRCIEETIRQGVKKADAAIVVVLKKLQDPELNDRGETVTEANSTRIKQDIQADELEAEQRSATARAWAREHPDEYAELEKTARTQFTGDSPFAVATRGAWLITEIHKRLPDRAA